MDSIADFTENEMWIIETTLGERYGSTQTVETQLADSEIRLHSSDRELTRAQRCSGRWGSAILC